MITLFQECYQEFLKLRINIYPIFRGCNRNFYPEDRGGTFLTTCKTK